LAFTWIWHGDEKRQLIELDFEELDGATVVRFTHSGLWDEEAVRSHEDGWGKCFDNLERAPGGGSAKSLVSAAGLAPSESPSAPAASACHPSA
jgi:activator of Hsp90 ATPase-like protein